MPVAQQYHQNVTHVLRKEINYNDAGVATGILVGRLPKGANVHSIALRTRTSFNAGTTNTLNVGTNPSNFDNLVTGAGLIGTGQAFPAMTAAASDVAASAEADVYAKANLSGTPATAGKILVVIMYSVDNS